MILVGFLIRPVIVCDLYRVEQIAGAGLERTCVQETVVAKISYGERRRRRDRIAIVEIVAAGRREIALVGKIRALFKFDVAHELRNEIVDVRVTLTVRVRPEVYRHAVDVRIQVRAVIELETAQVVLICLTAAAVLADDEAGNIFQHFARAQQRARRDLFLVDRAGRCGKRLTDEIRLPAVCLDGSDRFEFIAWSRRDDRCPDRALRRHDRSRRGRRTRARARRSGRSRVGDNRLRPGCAHIGGRRCVGTRCGDKAKKSEHETMQMRTPRLKIRSDRKPASKMQPQRSRCVEPYDNPSRAAMQRNEVNVYNVDTWKVEGRTTAWETGGAASVVTFSDASRRPGGALSR